MFEKTVRFISRIIILFQTCLQYASPPAPDFPSSFFLQMVR